MSKPTLSFLRLSAGFGTKACKGRWKHEIFRTPSCPLGVRSYATSDRDGSIKASDGSDGEKRKNLWSVESCIREHEKQHLAKKSDENLPRTIFIDGSWYHNGRNGRQEFETGPRIPDPFGNTTHYLDMEDISASPDLYPDLNPKALKVMLPPKSLFEATMDAMGIRNQDQVIIYGREGCIFTPRSWFLFRTFRHDRVGLMQGSLEEWISMGGPVETESVSYDLWAKDLVAEQDRPSSYTVPDDDPKSHIVNMQDMMEIVTFLNDDGNGDNNTVLVDTRGSSFANVGHMPGATHVPYSSLVCADNALRLKPREELLGILDSEGITRESSVVVTCGSGVSVCHMALVLDELGYPAPRIYDGSWNEWGQDPDTPKVVPSE